jgi:hypothetical protein
MRGCAEPAAHVRSREGLAARTLGVRVLKREPTAPLKRSDRLALGGRYYGVLSEASISSRDCLFSRRCEAENFRLDLFCHVHPTPARPLGRPPSSGAKKMPRAGADFSFASSDFKALGAFFCNFPNRDLVILEARLPEPRTVGRRTRCCGSEASEAIPFPGADSIFSSRCGAISRRLPFCRRALSRRDPGDRNASVQKIDNRLGDLRRDGLGSWPTSAGYFLSNDEPKRRGRRWLR